MKSADISAKGRTEKANGPTWSRASGIGGTCQGMWARQVIGLALAVLLRGPVVACCHPRSEPAAVSMNRTAPQVAGFSSVPTGVMSPEQALRTYQERALRQVTTLARYSDKTTIEVEIPAMAAKGQCSLRRTFSAPQSLIYRAVEFVGDTFVKTNVIYRLLESDVERTGKNTRAKVAILESNYRFSYEGVEDLNGQPLYAFALRPHRKDASLFKGKIFIDPQTGHINRAAGRLGKSPSWWIKRIDFIQDYADVGDFTMPAQIRSVIQARIAGRLVVDIQHTEFEVRSVEQLKSAPEEADHTEGLCKGQQQSTTPCTLGIP